jgi:hypothetical protein
MTRIAFTLSVVPLALAGLSALLWPSPTASRGDRLAPASVQTVQFMRQEGPTAAPGWPVVSQEPPPLPEPRPFQAGPPTPLPSVAEPARKIRRPAGLCARHGLRKVWVTSSRWRCRR